MSALASNDDPDEITLKAAFHQGLHCLLSQKPFSKTKLIFHLEIISI